MRPLHLVVAFAFLLGVFAGVSVAQAQCGIPGQYMGADGNCVCPEGTYHDRSTVACEQTTCPPEAGRTYTLECACPEGTVAQFGEYTTETGVGYTLVEACGAPDSGGVSQGGGLIGGILNTILPSSIFFPAGERFNDGYDSMVNGSGLERLAGAASLIGLAAEAGLAVVTLTGAARAAAGAIAARTAARAAAATMAQTAAKVVSRIGAAELPQIVNQTRPLLRTLLQQMKQAGTAINRQNILNVINQARQAQGLPAWGMSNMEILLKGIGMIPK